MAPDLGDGTRMAAEMERNGQKLAKTPYFHLGGYFCAISSLGPSSILSFPFSRDFCVGPVSHSVIGHLDRNHTS